MNESSPIYKTRFYSDCIGVFQGGGCRAAAFGGAYDAAFKLGVRFSEVAGTSAGSIVAALLAAGADPAFLIAKLKTLDFPSLLVNPTRSTFPSGSKVVSALQKVPFKGEVLNSIIGIARLGGLHSSAGIETWVEGCLKELTGKVNGPVLFRDLIMSLHVVAGDLSTMKPRVWSTQTTANQSVAHAVRASCTIPLFFQPVEEGSALLVDGGLVSNIPHFLFTRDGTQHGKGRKRILLFMLEASEERKRADDAKELLSQLASLAVDGATDVQLTFTPDIARIVIPTGSIRATDFNEMDEAKVSTLIANGSSATETFITCELLSTQGSPAETASISDEHEAYLTVCEQLYSTRSCVRVALPDTKWFWELFPTVLHWRKMNIRIVAFLPPIAANSPDGRKEHQRRTFMSGMGVELIDAPALPFHGILFDSVTDSGAGALTIPGERSDYEPAGRFYSGRLDQAAIAALHEQLETPAAPGDNTQHRPQLQAASIRRASGYLGITMDSFGILSAQFVHFLLFDVMKLLLKSARKGMPTSEILTSLVSENETISAIFVFAYRHPPLLQQRVRLTADEIAIIEKAKALRCTSQLPFWEALMLSCFSEDRDFTRLLQEATFHQSHADSLLRISRGEVLAGRLADLVAQQPSGYHLSFSSRIELVGSGTKQLPLLDFHCPESTENDRLVSNVCSQLYRGTTLLFSSGESYHALGVEPMDEHSFRNFLTRSLLFAPIVDARYVAHQLLEGACALRLSNSSTNPNRPRLKSILEEVSSE